MSRLPKRYWHEMTSPDFAALDKERVIAVLPVGAIEQHGPHLPVYVDACINAGIVARTIELLPADSPVTFLPAMPVGKSNEHISFPGTLTLSAETLTRLWTEIGESVARAGIRKFVIFNSHGGQPQVAEIVCRDLRVRHRMLAVTINTYGLGKPPGVFPADELRFGIHAGSSETSVMMHLRGDLVKDSERRNFEPVTAKLAKESPILAGEGRIAFGWEVQDLHPAGACGNALDADAARGKQVVDHAAGRFVQALAEIDRYPLSNIVVRN
ncbi:MAG: creatininase family protein [Rhodospirillales bacterium]|nr:creatininase family protein [Rhodospirillales bacterium]